MIAIPSRIKRALDVMESMLFTHSYYFEDGRHWSKVAKQQIEGMRIATKAKAIVYHDRILNGRKC
ncbi:TPA: hypothetical protein P9I14_004101 [Yersinia enterocolitica]|nr:hypothetical protein [Yersinia enterocolitica]